ncbi:MAG TPA: hypothetical protein VGR56_02080 [Nitrososphaerales archaeon]|nr:hypothetical protein [Nitrososphaerales archaeon]
MRPATAASVLSVSKTSSGLVTSDSLTTGGVSLWTFGGSAVVQGAPAKYSEDSTGLHLGVQSKLSGQWAGYYGARGENAQLFHATLSLPSTTLPTNHSFNTGLYVQTGGVNVNYVTCAGGVDLGGYFWAVVQATGNPNQATTYNTLWFQWMNGQSLTRDCTIVTNGSNILDVYFDGTLVYTSSSMNLGYQYPLTVFLEVQTTDNTAMHFSTYTDYYATTSDSVTVNGAPAGSTVEIVGPSGNVFASATAGLDGSAQIKIAKYHLPLTANVEVLVMGVVVASTTTTTNVYGGDVYSVGGLSGGGTGTAAPVGVFTSNPVSSGTINPNVGQGVTSKVSGPSGGTICIVGLCL